MTKSFFKLLVVITCSALATQVHALDALGRLFTSPEERANLDYLRQTTKAEVLKESTEANANEAAPVVPVMPSSITMQGYVKRSDGKKGTVWVNNQPLQEDSTSGEVQVGKLGRDGNQVQLKLPSTGKNFNLKAGQAYSTDTGTINELSSNARVSGVKSKNDDVIKQETLPAQSKTNNDSKP